MFYRYENHMVSAGVDEFDESLGSYMQLYCVQYQVTKVTNKGVRITDCAIERPVLDHYINKYAYPTKVEALLGFIARKRRQQSILNRQIKNSLDAEKIAQNQLFHELRAARCS